ncbi:DUF3499 domain-containing protein [Sinomonas sp. JGH33]|uniref:DUF3499 domain-containing protein n=1 Tax=Sinomonas terricola TaxID=3110330 RepID=A0ABU5T917_9MICC|nr:DUF3499 domain-containing protein [Sinomonas sp. JGH33]MEA5456196.1 DUF3499 domain-containing protein [Sinomonas sp. JGH33]
MREVRLCSRSACRESAVATLTYVYADSTAVLGPLATYPEPHTYDLCAKHAGSLTVPRGWEVLRLALPARQPSSDDLLALAEAVRSGGADDDVAPAEASQRTPRESQPLLSPPAGVDVASGRHLRILPDQL